MALTVDDIGAQVTAIRKWAVDLEDFDRAGADERALWQATLEAIAAGAGDPQRLAATALDSLLVRFPR